MNLPASAVVALFKSQQQETQDQLKQFEQVCDGEFQHMQALLDEMDVLSGHIEAKVS